ncbi:MAG: hypothetical protein JNL51_02195 [Chitinophagaceae bacterium]|nr:hypothetical protein [Chitinophagaceae bacterium]
MMNKLIISIVFLMASASSFCQDDQRGQALQELRKTISLYQQATLMSFDVKYRYASGKNPLTYMDSLSGSFRLDGSKFWYSLDETEMLFNGEYVVAVYKDDRIIYLSRPSQDMVFQRPVALIDSLLDNPAISYAINYTGKTKEIIVDFPTGERYKQIRYLIDKRSGLINKMTQLVKSSELYDPEIAVQTAQESEAAYSIVETIFSNYANKRFDAGFFRADRYFIKEGSDYIAASPYRSYKVFLGSSNL